MSPARVAADRDLCISGGRCMAVAPDVFDQDDEGIVVVLVSEPGSEQHEAVRRAAFLCPARAIRVEDDPAPA